MRVGDRVRMVDRYAARQLCQCRKIEPSWFDGMTGRITSLTPMMVHLDNERLPMRFDERDLDLVEEPGPTWVAGE